MEVIKTWMVIHKNGRTQMYQLKDKTYVIVVPTPTGQCWADICETISENEAIKYMDE